MRSSFFMLTDLSNQLAICALSTTDKVPTCGIMVFSRDLAWSTSHFFAGMTSCDTLGWKLFGETHWWIFTFYSSWAGTHPWSPSLEVSASPSSWGPVYILQLVLHDLRNERINTSLKPTFCIIQNDEAPDRTSGKCVRSWFSGIRFLRGNKVLIYMFEKTLEIVSLKAMGRYI